jgi:hypothetical protein
MSIPTLGQICAASLLFVASTLYSGALFAAPHAPPVSLRVNGMTFWSPLQCPSETKPISIFEIATRNHGLTVPKDTGTWVLKTMESMGLRGKLPTKKGARSLALQASALLKSGYIVAAKMAADEALVTSADYRQSSFANSFEALLTSSTQPIAHLNSFQDAPQNGAEGAIQRPSVNIKALSKRPQDLDTAVASLTEIISRADAAKRLLGPIYEMPSVRFYILAHGFRDAIALDAASRQVCSLQFDDATIRKLNISARYMAMPSRSVDKQ